MTVDSTNLSLTYIQIDVYFPKKVHLRIRIYILHFTMHLLKQSTAVMRSEEKNTEGFCKTQDGDNVFSRPVTNFLKIL